MPYGRTWPRGNRRCYLHHRGTWWGIDRALSLLPFLLVCVALLTYTPTSVQAVEACDYCTSIGKACNASTQTCYRCTDSAECTARHVCNADIGLCQVQGVFVDFAWQEGLLIVLVFLSAGLSNAGGVGGGLIFVPLLALLGGFPLPEASANSQSLIVGASLSNMAFNIGKRHVIRDAPRIDWNLVVSTMPFFLGGTTLGYMLNTTFPGYFTSFVLALMLLLLSIQSGYSGYRMAQRQLRERRQRLRAQHVWAERRQSPATRMEHVESNAASAMEAGDRKRGGESTAESDGGEASSTAAQSVSTEAEQHGAPPMPSASDAASGAALDGPPEASSPRRHTLGSDPRNEKPVHRRRRGLRSGAAAAAASCLPRSRTHSGLVHITSLYENVSGHYTMHVDAPGPEDSIKSSEWPMPRSASPVAAFLHSSAGGDDEDDDVDDHHEVHRREKHPCTRIARHVDPILSSTTLEEMLEAERPWFQWRYMLVLLICFLILLILQLLSGSRYARSPAGIGLCGAAFWVLFTVQEALLLAIGVLTVWRNRRLRRLRARLGYPWFEHDGMTDMRWSGSNLYVYPAFSLVVGAIDAWTGLSSSALLIPYLYVVAHTDLVTVQSSMSVVNLVAGAAGAFVFLVDGRINISYSLFYGLWALLGSYFGVMLVYFFVERYQLKALFVLALTFAFLAALGAVLYVAVTGVLALQAAGVGWQTVNICQPAYR
ncbi:hypothetical protein CDCA_CDCA08G2534 [Cyanidium caldarium]|uniref:Sulfite exporter TauE/SafE n=1 Tax=Cyanidium caldarium TaxID=2771 RepID=A0AAV9IWL1_CYACA|nr:hypothetical protein CDCA_CDCA08G2534 [Cyanidium caldarium]